MQAVLEREFPIALFIPRGILEQSNSLLLCIERRESFNERVSSIAGESWITIDCFHAKHPVKAQLLICDHRVPPERYVRCRTVPLTYLLLMSYVSQMRSLTNHSDSTLPLGVF